MTDTVFSESFKSSLAFTLSPRIEGFYSNDLTDRGGETYRGIARKKHPKWIGWRIIDIHKTGGLDLKVLAKDEELKYQVEYFYHNKFWVPIKGDEITNACVNGSKIAQFVFDCAVNMHYFHASLFLQESLNVLNKDQKIFRDIEEDGVIGAETIEALKVLTSSGKIFISDILSWYLIRRGNRYYEILRNDKTQEKYAKGWVRRLRDSIDFDGF